jgi:hypothetical protein
MWMREHPHLKKKLATLNAAETYAQAQAEAIAQAEALAKAQAEAPLPAGKPFVSPPLTLL